MEKKVRRVHITNVLGIEDLTITPGTLTVIEGRNAAGKTSALEAIRAVLSGGHEPDLIRRGAEAAEVVLTLADGIEIRKRITSEKSTLTVRHPQLGKISKAQRWLDEIIDTISLDPVAFLTASPKDRAQMLLEAIPMCVTREQIAFLPAEIVDGRDLSGHALEVLGSLSKQIYETRTGVNRAAKEKRATATQLVDSLPAVADSGAPWAERLTRAQDDLRTLQVTTRASIETMKTAAAAELDTVATKRQTYADDIKAELDRRIAALRSEAQRRLDENTSKGTAERQAVLARRDDRLAEVQREYEPQLNALTERIGEAKAKAEAEARAGQTRQFIARLETDASGLEQQSDELTEWIERLDRLKLDLLQQLPIPGLEIRDGQIFVDGVPFTRVNEAVKVRVALAVAQLRHRDLGLIVIDGLERLDSATFAAFRAEAERSGLQIVAARVSDTELAVSNGAGDGR